MDRHDGETAKTLREYIHVAAVRRREIAIVTVIAIVAALGFTWQQKHSDAQAATTQTGSNAQASASAEVRVVLASAPNIIGGSIDAITTATQAQIVDSTPLAEAVRNDLSLDISAASLLRHLSVRPIGVTQVISISYQDTDATEAKEIALAFAHRYLAFRNQQLQEGVSAARHDLHQAISLYRNATNSVTQGLALAQVLEARDHLSELVQQRSHGRARILAVSTQASKTAPAAQSTTSNPKYARNAAAGFVLGLILGLALAFVQDSLDERFRHRNEIERVLGIEVLHEVPTAAGRGAGTGFGLLAARLKAMADRWTSHSLIVTSTTEPDGAEAVADGLVHSVGDPATVSIHHGGPLVAAAGSIERGAPALLVIRPAVTTRPQAQETMRGLRDLGANIVGCVVTRADEARSPYLPLTRA